MTRLDNASLRPAALLAGVSLFALALGPACGGDDGTENGGGSAGMSSGGTNAGTSSAGTSTGGTNAGTSSAGTNSAGTNSAGTNSAGTSTGGSGGAPLRPPNPRTDIGPPDGVTCKTLGATTIECSVGEQCCPGDISGAPNECQSPGTTCDNCSTSMCAVVTCDGPEDCPNQLCCARVRDCTDEETCSGDLWTMSCEDRCEENGTVVCKDDRDCLSSDASCEQGTNRFANLCF